MRTSEGMVNKTIKPRQRPNHTLILTTTPGQASPVLFRAFQVLAARTFERAMACNVP